MRLPRSDRCVDPVGGRNELALCVANALMRAQISRVDQVTCCVCWPGVRRRAFQGRAWRYAYRPPPPVDRFVDRCFR